MSKVPSSIFSGTYNWILDEIQSAKTLDKDQETLSLKLSPKAKEVYERIVGPPDNNSNPITTLSTRQIQKIKDAYNLQLRDAGYQFLKDEIESCTKLEGLSLVLHPLTKKLTETGIRVLNNVDLTTKVELKKAALICECEETAWLVIREFGFFGVSELEEALIQIIETSPLPDNLKEQLVSTCRFISECQSNTPLTNTALKKIVNMKNLPEEARNLISQHILEKLGEDLVIPHQLPKAVQLVNTARKAQLLLPEHYTQLLTFSKLIKDDIENREPIPENYQALELYQNMDVNLQFALESYFYQ